MEDVKVAYMPFDYVQLSEEEIEQLPIAKTRSGVGDDIVAAEAALFPESYRYMVTYTAEQTTGGWASDRTYILPILYVVWPIDKALPEEIEYEIDYEVFLPYYGDDQTRALGMSTITLQALEDEAIGLALGISVVKRDGTRAETTVTIRGKVEYYDAFLKRRVPQPGLKQRFQLGSGAWSNYSQVDGSFRMGNQIPTTATYMHVFQDRNEKWKITDKYSTSPYAISWGSVASILASSDGFNMCPGSSPPVYDINPAVYYYYNSQTDFPEPVISGGLRIIANGDSGSANGYFRQPSTIEVLYNGGSSNKYIGTTLHEIGHFTHYQSSSTYAYPQNGFLVESFARYVGWYLGEQYYKSLGWIHPGGNPEIAGPAEQGWYKDYTNRKPYPNDYYDSGWYSPLFIDLTDNYNQKTTAASRYPDDSIKGVPASAIWNIVSTCKTWSQCKQKIQSYAGIYCTRGEYDAWIADFEHWYKTYGSDQL